MTDSNLKRREKKNSIHDLDMKLNEYLNLNLPKAEIFKEQGMFYKASEIYWKIWILHDYKRSNLIFTFYGKAQKEVYLPHDLIECLTNCGEYGSALEAIEIYEKKFGKDTTLLIPKANIYRQRGGRDDLDKEVRCYNKLIKSHKNDMSNHILKINALISHQKTKEALKALKRARRKLKSEDRKGELDLISNMIELNKNEWAKASLKDLEKYYNKFYDKKIKFEMKDQELKRNRYKSKKSYLKYDEKNNQIKEKLENIKERLDFDPALMYYQLARIHVLEGRHELALKALELSLLIDPSNRRSIEMRNTLKTADRIDPYSEIHRIKNRGMY